MAERLNRGDVHLCRFAPPDKQRRVLILTRQSAIGHLSTVTVAPITSFTIAPKSFTKTGPSSLNTAMITTMTIPI